MRLPRIPSAVGQVDKEQKWLPRLAPLLPLNIPRSACERKTGAMATRGIGQSIGGSKVKTLPPPASLIHAKQQTDLAQFITALQQIEASDGPAPGEHNFFRGVPLAMRDQQTRDAIAALQ